jgi:hypothetical protein
MRNRCVYVATLAPLLVMVYACPGGMPNALPADRDGTTVPAAPTITGAAGAVSQPATAGDAAPNMGSQTRTTDVAQAGTTGTGPALAGSGNEGTTTKVPDSSPAAGRGGIGGQRAEAGNTAAAGGGGSADQSSAGQASAESHDYDDDDD